MTKTKEKLWWEKERLDSGAGRDRWDGSTNPCWVAHCHAHPLPTLPPSPARHHPLPGDETAGHVSEYFETLWVFIRTFFKHHVDNGSSSKIQVAIGLFPP